jgi:hypothetical protein
MPAELTEERMPLAKCNVRSLWVVVAAASLGVFIASPAEARKASKQQRVTTQQWAAPGTVPRNTPPGTVVCWTPCGQRGAIVLGVDPDPAIRAQLLRDASRYFGGGDH